MKNTEKRKKEVLDNFDFERVHKVMEFLGWTWVTKKKERKLPDHEGVRLSLNNSLPD